PPTAESAVEYDALGEGVTFWLPAAAEEVELTGPIAAKLFVSSTTADADLFLVLRAFDPDGAEVTFQGALDPNTPLANGWLRASHRKLDPVRSTPFRPYHTNDEQQPLTPGDVYELDVEVWPTCIVLPPAYRLALSVLGRDYRYEGPVSEFGQTFVYAGRGVGPFTHNDPETRPPEIYGGRVTIHSGPSHPSHLLLPVIPHQARETPSPRSWGGAG